MTKRMIISALVGAALTLPSTSLAATFTFSNDGGSGEGTSLLPTEGSDFGLTLVGNNNGATGLYTRFSAISTFDSTITFHWNYINSDPGGSSADPFGFFVNDTFTPLTGSLDFPSITSGDIQFSVAAGDAWGFFILSLDGANGAATASAIGNITPVPLPAAGPLMAISLGAAAGIHRLRRKKVRSA